MILSDVMGEVAARLDTIDGLRTHAYPADLVTPPAAVVTYPTEAEFDTAYARGMDRITLPVVVLIGKVSDRASRDRLSAYLDGSGAKSLKRVIEFEPYPSYLSTTGVAGDTATTPHDAALDITGDLDLRIGFTPDDYDAASNQVLAAKWGNGADQAWQLVYTTDDKLSLGWRATTGTIRFQFPSEAALVVAGTSFYRVTLQPDVAGDAVSTFYRGGSIDGPWTLFGTRVDTGFGGVITSTTADLYISGRQNGTSLPYAGRTTHLRVLDGIDGTVVVDADFTDHLDGTTSFIDDTDRTWTVNGDASIVGPFAAAYTAFDTIRVTGAEFDVIQVAGVDHLAATLDLDITGPGGS